MAIRTFEQDAIEESSGRLIGISMIFRLGVQVCSLGRAALGAFYPCVLLSLAGEQYTDFATIYIKNSPITHEVIIDRINESFTLFARIWNFTSTGDFIRVLHARSLGIMTLDG